MRRRWVLAALGGIAVGWLVLYLLPPRSRGATLELLALGTDGRFSESVAIPSRWAQTAGLRPGAVVRVPLILAVRNSGNRPSPPTRLELNLPTRYRIVRSDGRSLPAEYLPGTPMVRYGIDVPPLPAASGMVAGYLPVLDTVWLEPIIPSFYCIALSDSVPDFVPSPPAPIEAIARVRIFYSFVGQDLTQRQTGLLAVQLDTTLLKQETPAPPPIFPAEYGNPEVPRPFLSTLEYAGSRQALCGDSQDPMEIMSTLWKTPGGGRLFVLYYGGLPRKYLYDLNRDSIIELEIWDTSGNGRFDARRPSHLPIPAFLMPLPEAEPYDPAVLATLPEEQLLALDRYSATSTGPYQFQSRPPDTMPRKNRFHDQIAIGDDEALELYPGSTVRYWTDRTNAAAPTGGYPRPPVGRMEEAPSARPGRQPGTTPVAPPTLGRPATPPTHAAPERRQGESNPDQRPEPTTPAPTAPKPGQTDTPASTAPKPAQPSAAEPKVLGRPLDGAPPRPRPDSTGHRR